MQSILVLRPKRCLQDLECLQEKVHAHAHGPLFRRLTNLTNKSFAFNHKNLSTLSTVCKIEYAASSCHMHQGTYVSLTKRCSYHRSCRASSDQDIKLMQREIAAALWEAWSVALGSLGRLMICQSRKIPAGKIRITDSLPLGTYASGPHLHVLSGGFL